MVNTNELWIDLLKFSYCGHIFLVVVVYTAFSKCSRQEEKAKALREGEDGHKMISCVVTHLFDYTGAP